jgi:hypothetical protein
MDVIGDASPAEPDSWLGVHYEQAGTYDRFDAHCEVMIPFKDNGHPWERAYLGVLDHPFFAVTDRNGAFTISGVPPGEYRLAAWHEKYGEQVVHISLEPSESRGVDLVFGPASVASRPK